MHVVGDRDAAAQYLPFGRKLLGAVQHDAAYQDLQVHKMRQVLPDGAEVVAEIHGSIPRITITPPAPPPPAKPVLTGSDDFIVWSRDVDHPAGIDAVFPQQILRPRWTTFFHDDAVAGYDDFAGEKGTYVGVFPDGVRYGANTDWQNEEGERIHWYGPSARYWVDGYRRPLAQFGKQVFAMGQPLIDIDSYCTASDVDFDERYVMGAAIDGAWLLLILGQLTDVSWPPPPAAATTTPDGWASPSYFTESVPLALRRFRMVIDPGLPGPMKRRVLASSHETLWTASVARGAAPWHFNKAATRAVAHMPPASAQHTKRGETWTMPSASHTRVELSIAGDGTVERSDGEVSLPAGDGVAAVIAEDGEQTLQLVRRGKGLSYLLGGVEYSAWELGDVTDFTPGRIDWLRRQLLCADLRAGVVLMLESRMIFAGGAAPFLRYSMRVVLCQGGAEVVLVETPTEPALLTLNPTYVAVLARLAGQAVSPLALVHLHAFGPSNLGSSTNFSMSLHASHYNVPFRRGDIFGQTRIAFFAGGWSVTANVVINASDTAANQQVDFAGHTTMPGFASAGGITAISYNTNVYTAGQEMVANFISGNSLSALTGIGGA
ncbi:MAG: hypothetical protein ACREP7_03030, partial [Lysobacter sp.]